jgi:hypothetical protein
MVLAWMLMVLRVPWQVAVPGGVGLGIVAVLMVQRVLLKRKLIPPCRPRHRGRLRRRQSECAHSGARQRLAPLSYKIIGAFNV